MGLEGRRRNKRPQPATGLQYGWERTWRVTREDQGDFKKVNLTLFDFKRRRSLEEVVSEGFLEEDSFRS